MEGREAIERGIADGSWHPERRAAEWAGHPNGIGPGRVAYDQAANRRPGDLAHRLILGESPREVSGSPPI
jgi:hypothetical protein